MNNFLFISDLDNTLIGDDEGLEELNQILKYHREKYETKIVYATGRSLFLYKQLLLEKPLISPDALIAAVGTEVYLNPENEQIDQDWASLLSKNWQRDKILKIANQFTNLVPQPNSEQGEFKISFTLPLQVSQKTIRQLESALQQENIDFKLIYSGSQDLDIIPNQADKGLAVKFIQNKWGMEDINTVVCGDSGNDISLFETGKPRGIIVGNAQPELKQWYQENKQDYHYLATQNYAQGIREGLQHFQLI